MLPNFLVIGAMKAGTTSLYHYLDQHPQIYMSPYKEPDFFVAERGWKRGWDWYESLFERAGGATAIGEASTRYSMYPEFSGVPGRIVEHIPEVRLIYLIRHPLDRAKAHYLHNISNGDEDRHIDDALVSDPRYLHASDYALQIDRYLEHVDRNRLLILVAEHLATDPTDCLVRAFDHLGLDRGREPTIEQTKFNVTSERKVVRPTIRKLRRSRAFRAVVDPLPTRWKRYLDRHTSLRRSGSLPSEIQMSRDTEARLVDGLSSNLARLPGLMGEDFDCWGLV